MSCGLNPITPAAHISTVPTYPNGPAQAAEFDPDGVCHCDRPHPLPVVLFGTLTMIDTFQCGRCYRPVTS